MKLDLGKILQSINKGPKPSTDTLFVSNKNNSDTAKNKIKTKELPTIFINDKSSSRIKKYQDSLNLYNSSIEMAKNIAKGVSKGIYEKNIKNYGYKKNDAEKEYKRHLNYYTKQLVDPLTKGTKPNFGAIRKYKKETDEDIKQEIEYFKRVTKDSPNDFQSRYMYDAMVKGYNNLSKINNKIKPVSYRTSAELPIIPIYKKPVQPVEYREEVKKKEEPKTVLIKREVEQAVQNKYEGRPVYYPTVGSGGPSALVGFSNNGDTTFIKPEDFDRFAVPKYAKEFIKSRSKKK